MPAIFSLIRAAILLVLFPAQTFALDFKLETARPAFLDQLFQVYQGDQYSAPMQRGFMPAVGFGWTDYKVIRVSGLVEKGDDAKLWQLILKSGGTRFVLLMDDVPGGSFAEAMTIGDRIYRSMHFASDTWVVGVVVPKGGRCDSACAVIGAFAGEKFFIQPGADVGFHLPFLPKATVDAVNRGPSDVEAIMATTYEISLAYSEMGLRRMATPWLIREAYKHGTAESFFRLETAEDIHRAGFTPIGPRSMARPITVQNMRLEALGRICDAAYERSRLPKTRADAELATFVMRDSDQYGSIPSVMKKVKRRWFRIEGFYPEGVNGFACVFGLDSKDRLHLRVTKSAPPCIATYKQLPRMCAVKQPRDVSFLSKHAYDKAMSR